MIKVIVIALSAIWESIWRRGFGSDWYETKTILKYRTIIHLMNICFFLIPMLYWRLHNYSFKQTWYIWAVIVAIVAIVEGLFWSRGHGFAYDVGRHGDPDEKMIKRYEAVVYNHYFLTPLYKKLGLKLYGYSYDLFSMLFRYTLPTLLLIPFYKWYIIFMGVAVTFVYAFCWTLKEKGESPDIGPTQHAEYMAGFSTGLFLSWLCLNGFIFDYLCI